MYSFSCLNLPIHLVGMAAIFAMWPGPSEQTFVPPSYRGSIWNLNLTGQAVSEEQMFKGCGRRTTGAYLSYKLTNEPKGSGELNKSCMWNRTRNLIITAESVTRIATYSGSRHTRIYTKWHTCKRQQRSRTKKRRWKCYSLPEEVITTFLQYSPCGLIQKF